jgi:hypothetical protein
MDTLNCRCFTKAYKTEPKPLQSTALENIGGWRTDFGSSSEEALNSPSAITFENNKKILDQPQAENGFSGDNGGGKGTGIKHPLFLEPDMEMV